MNYLLKLLSDFNNYLCKFLVNLTGLILVLISIIFFYAVLMRYTLNSPVTWSEDAAKILMVWMILLGAPVGLKAGNHVSIDLLLEELPEILSKLLRIISVLLIVFTTIIVLKYGWSFALRGMRRIVPSIDWMKFGVAYLALPVGYGLMLPICFEQILRHIAELCCGYKK